jgi:Flp pilus assembly protein TadG
MFALGKLGYRLLVRFLRDEDGSWLILTAVMMPVLIGVAGLGTEGGLLFYQHRTLQSAADAAAYSAAISYSYSASADITTQAKAVVASYGYTLGTGTNQANVAATATTYASQPAVQVTISRPQTAIFSSIYFPTLANSVSATAILNGGAGGASPSGGCVLALGNTSTGNNLAGAIALQGTPSISVPNCGMFSDSTADCSTGSISLGGTATITAGSLGSAGCTHISGSATVTLQGGATCNASISKACTNGDGTITDPYAGTALPSSPATCTQNNYNPGLNFKTTPTFALPPGRYCGTTTLHGTGGTPTIVLSTGVYIFDSQGKTGTTLDLKNVAFTDKGVGATLVFTCSTCSSPSKWPPQMMTTDSNTAMCVTAPTTGATAGFVIMADPAMPLIIPANPTKAQLSTWANAGTYFDGTIWSPTASFSWGGNATTAPSACNYPTSGLPTFCLQLIANQVNLGGTSDYFGGSGCTLSGGGGSGASGGPQKPIGSAVTLVD